MSKDVEEPVDNVSKLDAEALLGLGELPTNGPYSR